MDYKKSFLRSVGRYTPTKAQNNLPAVAENMEFLLLLPTYSISTFLNKGDYSCIIVESPVNITQEQNLKWPLVIFNLDCFK